jgi:hypothetical protein
MGENNDIKIKWSVRTNMIGSEVTGEFAEDRETWDALNEQEKSEAVWEDVWNTGAASIHWDEE